MVTNPKLYHMFILRSALKLECLGMKRSRSPSAYSIVKREFGFRGTKTSVYTQLCEEIEKWKALADSSLNQA